MAQIDTEPNFRHFIPDTTEPRFRRAAQQDAHGYADSFRNNQNPPWLFQLTETWQELLAEPFKGVTSDGNIRANLFHEEDHGINMGAIVDAADTLIEQLTTDQRHQLQYPINAREWRAWSNPEILLRDLGLRLEEMSSQIVTSALHLLNTTLAPEGFAKAQAAMRMNDFLGQLCGMPKVMNQLSYNLLLFGTPSTADPWGWLLYGHHLCISCFLVRNHIIISPTFTGAEPNVIDAGAWAGTTILQEEGRLGLKLMQSLDAYKQKNAQRYRLLRDPQMTQIGDLRTDRWNQDDQRHLCGAFRDNRIVPYEGEPVARMDSTQKHLVLDIMEQFLLYLPSKARESRKQEAQEHFDETFFSWIGAWGDQDPFYFRIQGPTIICEFDHHSGVFLSNSEPAKFHTHTILRTPNAGDYGQALRKASEKIN